MVAAGRYVSCPSGATATSWGPYFGVLNVTNPGGAHARGIRPFHRCPASLRCTDMITLDVFRELIIMLAIQASSSSTAEVPRGGCQARQVLARTQKRKRDVNSVGSALPTY